ncbi:MAG: helix-turn-helix domain-containing protein [Waterburya sp.]
MVHRKLWLVANSDKSVFRQLIEAWGINQTEFASRLGIKYTSLWNYQAGKRTFSLDLKQMKIFEAMLDELGLRISDLPDDWIIDKIPASADYKRKTKKKVKTRTTIEIIDDERQLAA